MVTTLKFRNNDEMPILGLGTFRSEPNEVYNAVFFAIKMGYRHIDCAAAYGNEKEVGKAIAEAIKQGLVTREDLWVTSKLWNASHGEENVIPALHQTLEDLQLNYLDLYLIHWPVALKKGTEMPERASDFVPLSEVPLTNTWKGMEAALEEGLTKHIGVSNFNENHLKEIMATAVHQPEMNQVEIHPFLQQEALQSFCVQNDILLTAYAPLGSLVDENSTLRLLENDTIKTIAEARHMSPAQVALAYTMQRGIAVIPKSINEARLLQNLETLNHTLTEEDMAMLKDLDQEHRFIDGKFWEVDNGPYTADSIWNA
ncbi:aldo/keto reductase [Pseudozobellia thermophila]|uniref:Aldo/keto reductase family protein n=1 Tax=Pseudozobellia thermophila TaxID=192903 RepID=A0A1M6EBV7_9FLAO|nr:aldo/keto reductase [Pseudozobellia thermophila]SHI82913.1 Aldo/keto reductase family protein [Pseudozobellia thermophila]